MEPNEVLQLTSKTLLPDFAKQKTRMDHIDRWARWDHDNPHAPSGAATREYRDLAQRAQTPWGTLVVTAVAQGLFVDGYRGADDSSDAAPWGYWQANKLDKRQIGVHRTALNYGLAYTIVTPGKDSLTGDPVPAIRGATPRRMIAHYDDPVVDDWPTAAMLVEPRKDLASGAVGYLVKVYDDQLVHKFFTPGGAADRLEARGTEEHGVGVCPVIRFDNIHDLEGRAVGEIEPLIPVLGRLDQTAYDRIVVQRFAAWVVRTISGMDRPENASEASAEKLKMMVDSILIFEDPETKVGSLPATPLDGFIKAHDSDLRDLAAVSQTPPHHLLGQMANLSAEALVAAEAALTAKKDERQHSFGESWEQTLRLAAHVAGDTAAAADTSAQVQWRDTQSRSLAQAADALGKLAQMLSVPVEFLWEKIPGWTKQDVERAKELASQGSALDAVLAELAAGQTAPGDTPPAPPGLVVARPGQAA